MNPTDNYRVILCQQWNVTKVYLIVFRMLIEEISESVTEVQHI